MSFILTSTYRKEMGNFEFLHELNGNCIIFALQKWLRSSTEYLPAGRQGASEKVRNESVCAAKFERWKIICWDV